MALPENTAGPDDIDAANVDAIYFTGAHAVMYDFPDSASLERLTPPDRGVRRDRGGDPS